ncbi:hypothetical protein H5P28_15720 [Ruficoccus amylovorans]|uniref:DUF5666 domain-containing protein n=1 Tax=Ruficoccus amylovorans TaxID=1804625 RepID=A0A842HGA3_9BACT|nr:hypothetical protein [Ruficoccus amylovorans]MBC2595715.1 hypothetical protein [Ruficoccus amylovorans]
MRIVFFRTVPSSLTKVICLGAGLFCLFLLLPFCSTTMAGEGVRTSLSGTVLSVDEKAKTFTCRTSYEGKAMNVTVEIPRPNYIYYRWEGTAQEIRRGDTAEIAGTISADGRTIVPGRVGLFKGTYTRGGDYLSIGDGGAIQLRGKLGFRDGVWSAYSENSIFTVVFPDDVQVLIHDDVSASILKKGDKVSFSGVLDDGRMTRVAQLYIREVKPGYVADAPMARGGNRLFEGKVHLIDRELKLFVGSGELDGETVPMTVRWTGEEPTVYTLSAGTVDDLESGQTVVVPRDKLSGGLSAMFVLAGSSNEDSGLPEWASYPEIVAGEIVVEAGVPAVSIAGVEKPRSIPAHMQVMLTTKAGLGAVKVGQTFLALGAISDEGRWLLNDPALILLFQ